MLDARFSMNAERLESGETDDYRRGAKDAALQGRH
jgi:hypothetical protein